MARKKRSAGWRGGPFKKNETVAVSGKFLEQGYSRMDVALALGLHRSTLYSLVEKTVEHSERVLFWMRTLFPGSVKFWIGRRRLGIEGFGLSFGSNKGNW